MPAFVHEARIHGGKAWSMEDSNTLAEMDVTSSQFGPREVIQQETSNEPRDSSSSLEALGPKGVSSIGDNNLTGVIIVDYRGDVNTMCMASFLSVNCESDGRCNWQMV